MCLLYQYCNINLRFLLTETKGDKVTIVVPVVVVLVVAMIIAVSVSVLIFFCVRRSKKQEACIFRKPRRPEPYYDHVINVHSSNGSGDIHHVADNEYIIVQH